MVKLYKLFSLILITSLIFCILANNVNNNIELKVIERKKLLGIPSASGISVTNDSIYVIVDNSPYVFQINQNYKIVSKLETKKLENKSDTLFSKDTKPDYEAFESIIRDGENKFYIFGSGSKSPQRDVLLIIENNNSIKPYSLEAFYNKIKLSKELDGNFLNIEAVASNNNELFLFNRGKNLIIQFSLKEFEDYLILGKKLPDFKIYEIKLPKIREIVAGFSGATVIPNQNKIIFTASVEDTSNPIYDGEILGSFVGIINLNEIKNQYVPVSIPISENSEILKIKVESVSIRKQISENNAEILMVTDSDDGFSEILKCNLKW